MDDVSDDTCDFENDDTHWNGKMEKKEREKNREESTFPCTTLISFYKRKFGSMRKSRYLEKKKKRIERKALYNLTAVDQYSTDIL